NDVAGLGFDLQCPPKSLARLDDLSAVAELETTPLLPPFGTQLLAYYTPGFRTAEETTFVTVGKKQTVVFEKGKEYLVLPSFEKQVIEVAPQLVERGVGTTKKRLIEKTDIVHNYQRFLCSSELSPADLTIVHNSV